MSKLSIGIVGLPNVGKSTLFKALTKKEVNIANYPFCTIDPNIGIVTVPDERLNKLSVMSKSAKTVPAVVEFYDIAGLVKGANKGEGLGNKFLSHIREVNIVVQVVRAFQDSEIIHIEQSVDPIRDIDIINTELELKDMESKENINLLAKKKKIYFINGRSEDVSDQVREKIRAEGAEYIVADLRKILRQAQNDRSINELIKKAYATLGLISFFTTGEMESRAWTIKAGSKAPQAAGVIHTDFEKKFIKAEVINWQKLLEADSWVQAKNKGLIKLEGKEYIVQEGDVMIIKHS